MTNFLSGTRTILCIKHLSGTCICKIKFVLCSVVRICLLTFLYISSLGLWYLPADVSNNLFLSICISCMNCVVITTLLLVGLRVTYMYLYSPVLTLFLIQYYIYFVILFLLCFYKANNFSGVGVSHFSTSSNASV